MRATLKFWITDGCNPELYKLEFLRQDTGEKRFSVRGNTGGAYHGAGSFRWSSAVQALTALGLNAAAASAVGAGEAAQISGGRGSKAASLDYAIGKNTTWLHELFGDDTNGKPLSRRILNRSNPELRRSGPATVSFNSGLLADNDVMIFVEEQLCDKPDKLAALSSAILEKGWVISERGSSSSKAVPGLINTSAGNSATKFLDQQRLRGPLPFPFRDKHNRQQLKAIYRKEVLSMLYATNIFDRWDLEKAEAQIKNNQTFKDLAGRHIDTPIVSDIDQSLLSADRLGVSRYHNNLLPGPQDEPIRCYVPVVEITTLAILYYIKYIKGCNLEITFGYSHSRMLLNELRQGQLDPEPDILFMAIGPAAGLIGLGEATPFLPLMLMPRITFKIAAPAGNVYPHDAPHYGKYLFMNDRPSSPQYYFNSLAEKGFFYKGRVEVLNMEPHEVTSAFRSGDPNLRSIMWWPHHELTRLFGNSSIFEDISDESGNIDTICFANRRMHGRDELLRAFDVAVRDAWLRLMDEGPSLDLVLDLLVEDREYVRFLKRISGMHYLFPPEKDVNTDLQVAPTHMRRAAG